MSTHAIEQPLLTFFTHNSIAYALHQHQPVFTTHEADTIRTSIPGAHSKNLFLKDSKKKFLLLSVLDHKSVDLKALSKQFGRGGFSFANEGDLFDVLGVRPGSVTPYALLNDTDSRVTFLLDKDFLCANTVNFHPLRNDMTVSVAVPDFLRFFELTQHTPQIIEVPLRSA